MIQAMHEVNLYSRIDGSGYRNIWVVGDLHGCYTRLMSELHRVDFDPAQDLLISVGDLIDRGTENVECLELLQMPWFRSVMGNHERLMIDALSPDGNVNNWLMNGGQWFFMLDADQEILARALVELVRRLPYIIELNTGHETIVIAHADYPGGEYQFGKDVSLFDVVWSRSRVGGFDRWHWWRNHRRRSLYLWAHTGTKTKSILESALHRHGRGFLRKSDANAGEGRAA